MRVSREQFLNWVISRQDLGQNGGLGPDAEEIYDYLSPDCKPAQDSVVNESFKLALAREVLEEVARPPYQDSDLASLLVTLQQRAREALKKL